MRLFSFLLFLFLTVPLLEIFLLIKVGNAIGAWPTILLVIVTAVIGAALLRQQGLATLRRAQTALEQGQLPAAEVVEGPILLLCGALLLTPGFCTDALGFALLVPPLRSILARGLLQRLQPPPPRSRPRGRPRGQTLDSDYRVEDP